VQEVFNSWKIPVYLFFTVIIVDFVIIIYVVAVCHILDRAEKRSQFAFYPPKCWGNKKAISYYGSGLQTGSRNAIL